MVEGVLDDLVVGHRSTSDERVGGVVADRGAGTPEGSGAGGADEREVADFGERASGECTDERGCGFGPSDLGEDAVTPVERGRK